MIKQGIRNKIDYIVTVISCFAEQYKLTNKEAYAYLRRFSGLDFLNKHYDIEHTLSIENAVEDLQLVCFNHGGKIQ